MLYKDVKLHLLKCHLQVSTQDPVKTKYFHDVTQQPRKSEFNVHSLWIIITDSRNRKLQEVLKYRNQMTRFVAIL